MKILPAFSGLLLSSLPLPAAIVVNTDDNDSPANDKLTSLVEALTNVTDGETITFAIPGAGPHYLLTPENGYPIVSKNGVTIDGYSQTGSSPNTAGLREPNNAKIQIVLDSRTNTPGARRTVLDFPGFSTEESGVLSFMDARATTVRGLAFIGVAGTGNFGDASVYNVAFVKECAGSKVQGCWFGLDPAMTSWKPGPDGVVQGVFGARSAVAAFKWDDFDSIGLTFGNDSNGTGDRGEFNICMAQRLAVHLQTRAVRISGNWINVFPDGSLLNLEKQGLVLEDGTLEAIENGNPLGMLIGTDGNGQGDADEGNIFGPIIYDSLVECWGSNVGVVFAGNSVGVGLDNLPAFTTPDAGLFSLRKNSDLRVGSAFDGTGDAAETNTIHGLGQPFIHWHNNNNDASDKAAVVNVRRNVLIDNYGGIPHDVGSGIPDSKAYDEVLEDPSNPVVTLSVSSGVQLLQGTVPLPKTGVNPPVIDVYLADPFGLYHSPPVPQGRYWLASYPVDAEGDTNPDDGKFAFDTQALNLTLEELGRVTFTATYSLTNGRAVTTNFSATLSPLTAPATLDSLTVNKDPGGLQLQWTGGTAPFGIFSAADPAGPWTLLSTTSAQNIVTPLNGARRYYRVRDGLSPR